MEHIVRERIYPQPARRTPPLKLPPLLLIVVILLVGFGVVTIAASLVTRYQPAPPNPFPAYADIFPGEPASALETRGFSCQYFYDFYHRPGDDAAPSEGSCILTPTSGIFSSIQGRISQGTIHELIFIMNDNTLRIGDLAQSLGMPTMKRLKHTVYFVLPTNLVRVDPIGHSAQFSVFAPIGRITFIDLI